MHHGNAISKFFLVVLKMHAKTNLIKDELPAEADRRKDYIILLIPGVEEDGLPVHVLGQCVGTEVEAEAGQHQVQDDPQAGQEVAVGNYIHHTVCHVLPYSVSITGQERKLKDKYAPKTIFSSPYCFGWGVFCSVFFFFFYSPLNHKIT